MISPGSMRAISAATFARSHSPTLNSPVEISIQASAKRSSSDVKRDAGQRQQIVVAAGIEQRIFGERSGRHQPDDIAAHDTLGAALARLCRILELLAHGDAMAVRDQPMQIFVGALDRHAAHRNILTEMLAAFGQDDAERPRRHLRILEEQLVKIAHPIEQQAVRIGGFDLDVLLHHRRDAHGVGGGLAAIVAVRIGFGRGRAFRRCAGTFGDRWVGRVHGGGR